MPTLTKQPTEVAAPSARRVNFNLSEQAHAELLQMARASRRSLTELLRLGIGLVRIALDAQARGEKLVVTSGDGQPLKEIVLP